MIWFSNYLNKATQVESLATNFTSLIITANSCLTITGMISLSCFKATVWVCADPFLRACLICSFLYLFCTKNQVTSCPCTYLTIYWFTFLSLICVKYTSPSISGYIIHLGSEKNGRGFKQICQNNLQEVKYF